MKEGEQNRFSDLLGYVIVVGGLGALILYVLKDQLADYDIIPCRKLPSDKEILERGERRKRARIINQVFLTVSLFAACVIFFFGFNKPNKSEFIEFISNSTEYSEHEVIDFYKMPIMSVGVISSDNEEYYFVGSAGRFFETDHQSFKRK